ncbi:hypothetical protein AQUCO_07200136v1 [Aquilegia coerulea]|uniref:Uncharacterized protein n=1 Tax=Aquilegia coerulea TaxID=218851 RepID=A0A2G5CAH1_AQUCA|nr:hypothetical protein AQUCO_07200136v1 [Aquilegia coerulea]
MALFDIHHEPYLKSEQQFNLEGANSLIPKSNIWFEITCPKLIIYDDVKLILNVKQQCMQAYVWILYKFHLPVFHKTFQFEFR